MKTLLAVMSYEKGNAACFRHWDFWLRTGCDILGVGHEDTTCLFPGDRLIGTVKIGKDSYAKGDAHPRRLIGVLEHCISLPYDEIWIIEYDAITLKPPPIIAEGFMGTVGGYRSPGFHASTFYHCAWGFTKHTAGKVVRHGKKLIEMGLIEQGFIDRWLGMLVELFDIPTEPSHGYSRNTILPEHASEVRLAIKQGAWVIHGCKTEETLKAILA